MKYQIQRKLGSGRLFFMMCGGVLLGISLCGMPDWALASDRQIWLYVDSGRLTGGASVYSPWSVAKTIGP